MARLAQQLRGEHRCAALRAGPAHLRGRSPPRSVRPSEVHRGTARILFTKIGLLAILVRRPPPPSGSQACAAQTAPVWRSLRRGTAARLRSVDLLIAPQRDEVP